MRLNKKQIFDLVGYVQYELDNPEQYLALDIVDTLVHDIQGIVTEEPDSGFVPKSSGYKKHNPDYMQKAMQEAMQGEEKDGTTI